MLNRFLKATAVTSSIGVGWFFGRYQNTTENNKVNDSFPGLPLFSTVHAANYQGSTLMVPEDNEVLPPAPNASKVSQVKIIVVLFSIRFQVSIYNVNLIKLDYFL